MDPTRFDTLTRSLTGSSSRRGLARLLGGFTLGGPLALLGFAEAEAKRKKHNNKKRKKRKKRDGQNESPPPPPPPPNPCAGQPACDVGLTRNPLTCDCCRTNGASGCFSGPPSCCSSACVAATNICRGRSLGAGCEFDAQCESGTCGNTGQCA